ncbi:transposase, Ptta/En/Spm, transposase, Tnp1/En/Spm-like protein [Tanacetum coccineum]
MFTTHPMTGDNGELTCVFDVDLTVRKLVMNHLGQLLRNFRRKLRQAYILPNQDTPSKLNEVPAKYTTILKAEDWVNFVNYTATEEYKVKSAKAKMARSKCVFPHTMGRGRYDMRKKKMKETETRIKRRNLVQSEGKIMLHNKALPKDCYKVSIDKSLVDATFIPIGRTVCTTVLDTCLRHRLLFPLEATPPSTIQMITGENKTAPKVQTKRKNVYVSSDAMQKEANKKRSQKALVLLEKV